MLNDCLRVSGMLLESLRKSTAAGRPVTLRHDRCKPFHLGGGFMAVSPQDQFSYVLGLAAWWISRQTPKQDQLEPVRQLPALNRKADDLKTAQPASGREPTKESPTRRTVALPAGSVFRDRLKNGREGPEMVV